MKRLGRAHLAAMILSGICAAPADAQGTGFLAGFAGRSSPDVTVTLRAHRSSPTGSPAATASAGEDRLLGAELQSWLRGEPVAAQQAEALRATRAAALPTSPFGDRVGSLLGVAATERDFRWEKIPGSGLVEIRRVCTIARPASLGVEVACTGAENLRDDQGVVRLEVF